MSEPATDEALRRMQAHKAAADVGKVTLAFIHFLAGAYLFLVLGSLLLFIGLLLVFHQVPAVTRSDALWWALVFAGCFVAWRVWNWATRIIEALGEDF